MIYKVVDPRDFCEEPDPEDWVDIEAGSVSEAAEAFCEQSDRDNRYEYINAEGGQVLVRDPDGRVYQVAIHAVIEHYYNALSVAEV